MSYLCSTLNGCVNEPSRPGGHFESPGRPYVHLPAHWTGSWVTPTLLETDNAGMAYSSEIAVDANGNALSVWVQYDGGRFGIRSNRYDATTGTWGTATLIEGYNAGSAWGPKVVIDAGGNALAVWRQFDGTRDNIWSSRFE